jgi:hypothetical protein
MVRSSGEQATCGFGLVVVGTSVASRWLVGSLEPLAPEVMAVAWLVPVPRVAMAVVWFWLLTRVVRVVTRRWERGFIGWLVAVVLLWCEWVGCSR